MGSVGEVLPSRDSTRIAKHTFDGANIRLFSEQTNFLSVFQKFIAFSFDSRNLFIYLQLQSVGMADISQFVNSHRINEAMSILVDKRYQDLRMEEVSDMVGFANRQSFYSVFYRFKGITPRQYRLDNLQKHPAMVAKRK